MNHLETIQSLLQEYPDGRVIFEEKLRIKLTPHHHAFEAWGAWHGPDGTYLLDGAGDWHGPLQENQLNAAQVITSLYQRLKLISYAGSTAN